MQKKQTLATRTISLIKRIVMLMVIIIFAMATVQLAPIYLEYHSVLQIMDDIETEIIYNKLTKNQVYQLLRKRFDANYVPITNVEKENIELLRSREAMYVTKIIIDYEVSRPFFAHVYLVGRFHAEVGRDN